MDARAVEMAARGRVVCTVRNEAGARCLRHFKRKKNKKKCKSYSAHIYISTALTRTNLTPQPHWSHVTNDHRFIMIVPATIMMNEMEAPASRLSSPIGHSVHFGAGRSSRRRFGKGSIKASESKRQ